MAREALRHAERALFNEVVSPPSIPGSDEGPSSLDETYLPGALQGAAFGEGGRVSVFEVTSFLGVVVKDNRAAHHLFFFIF